MRLIDLLPFDPRIRSGHAPQFTGGSVAGRGLRNVVCLPPPTLIKPKRSSLSGFPCSRPFEKSGLPNHRN